MRKILHSFDKVDDIVENVKSHLGIFDILLIKNRLLAREISEWRAVHHFCSFLNGEKNTIIKNIYNGKISNELVHKTHSISDKRNEYFKNGLNALLENITYRNISIKPEQLLENSIYESDSSNYEIETD